MEMYIGMGFFVLCIGISISIIICLASFVKYHIHLSNKKLEVFPQQETTPSSTTHE